MMIDDDEEENRLKMRKKTGTSTHALHIIYCIIHTQPIELPTSTK